MTFVKQAAARELFKNSLVILPYSSVPKPPTGPNGWHTSTLHMPEVAALVKHRASALSGGQQKMVALARAVMSGTKLLLLDEPFEGPSPAMGEKLAGTIQALQQDDLSVLIAESDVRRLRFAAKICTIERSAILHQAKNET